MADVTKIVEFINNVNEIGLYTHINADGDSLGACCGLALVLKELGKNVKVYIEEAVEERLEFLIYPGVKAVFGKPEGKSPAFSLALDCGTADRLGVRFEFFTGSALKAVIDHHKAGVPFGDIFIVDTNWSATCEGVYELINLLDTSFDRESAICLFTGILTDTGGFAYSNTTYTTHLIASKLQEKFGDSSWIYRRVMEMVTKEQLDLYSRAYGKIQYYCRDKIAWLDITSEDYLTTGTSDEDAQAFPGMLRSIKGVSVSVVTKPNTDGNLKVSLRSDETCDVAEVSARYAGGGHLRAAGFTWVQSTGELKEILLSELERAMDV
ncbi:MAG: bifunctional oligoribonuclease/PAP phosphatase NrnA [Clostridiales bacterium]|nr:bifunctional oligoribonuclease/PAP phosphatase NrnA [Clostridiales bacterium]